MTTETNAERLEHIRYQIDDARLHGGMYSSTHVELEWLIQQAERVQELERQNMRYRRALKHITVFPTYFSRDQHSKRALKIARKVLKGES